MNVLVSVDFYRILNVALTLLVFCLTSTQHLSSLLLYLFSLIHRSCLRWVCAGGTRSVSVYAVNNSPLFFPVFSPALPLSPPLSSLWHSHLPSPQYPSISLLSTHFFPPSVFIPLSFLLLSSLCPLNMNYTEVSSYLHWQSVVSQGYENYFSPLFMQNSL